MTDYDGYCVFEESDEEEHDIKSESSDNELDIILHGTPKQKRRLTRSLSRGSLDLTDASSSEDDFEKEVEAELDATMKSLEEKHKNMGEHTLADTRGAASTSSANLSENKEIKGLEEAFYDDIYFDTDDEEEDEKVNTSKNKKAKKKHRVVSNDDLFYDPDIDDENERWINKQRDRYKPKKSGSGDAANQCRSQNCSEKVTATTDAVLNCPACMASLCIDCQKHDFYRNQFRAMFVINCVIVKDEVLRYKEPIRQGKKRQRNQNKAEYVRIEANETSEEIYHPVKCGECNTEVAVYDKDEVYHFHNVLASAP
ncbi:E2F-associated phosphoprotein-like [Saccoglossus kowalevskii]|uniref:E2F-associated phosphoprotein-like n=1 Tax=Saccoglossus kowalevskii TaxID=10224 RepID=A0ABM0MKD4_SACKO|nr:PREDICTED: E2F-associated phosphoprotein-like [Saccoglossus kowalevskii]